MVFFYFKLFWADSESEEGNFVGIKFAFRKINVETRFFKLCEDSANVIRMLDSIFRVNEDIVKVCNADNIYEVVESSIDICLECRQCIS